MAKTINKDVDIFTTLKAAQKSFDKTQAPVALLKSYNGDYFVDRKGTGKESAIVAWPKLYTLLDEKQLKSHITYKGKTNSYDIIVEIIAESDKQMKLFVEEAIMIIKLNQQTIGFEKEIEVKNIVDKHTYKTHVFEINDEMQYQITCIIN